MGYIGPKPTDAPLTSADLEDGIVTTAKIVNSAVTTAKVADANITVSKILDSNVTSGKINDTAVTTAKLAADSVTNAKTEFTPGLTIKGDGSSADGKITLNCSQNSHGVSIQGPPHSAGQSYTLTLPQSITNNYYLKTDGSGNLSFAAIEESALPTPTIASISPSTIDNTASTVVITGTNFGSTGTPYVDLISSAGAITAASSVTRDSTTQITITTTLAVDTTYFIRIELASGLAVRSSTALLTVSDAPAWVTASGNIGSSPGGEAVSVTVSATSATSYAKTVGSFPGGVTLNTSTGVISGTESGASSATTYSFTIRATDAEGQTADRAFSYDITFGLTQGMAFV